MEADVQRRRRVSDDSVGRLVCGGPEPVRRARLAGNVAEWTASGYSQDYGHARNNVTRVLRGGSSRSEIPTLARAANRHKNTATDRLGGIGFHCAQ